MRQVLLSIFVLVSSVSLLAQQTVFFTNTNQDYKTATDLFSKEKYGAAKYYFDLVSQSTSDKNALIRIESEYFAALCAIELFNKEAEELLKNFIDNHPESPRIKTASFFMGKYKYRKKQYDEAVFWYEKTNVDDLSQEEIHEYYFKRGYSYLELNSNENAEKDFYNIKDANGKYAAPALFYYSHIQYVNKKHETALAGFQKLTADETFAVVVPFYICQIYYLQGKYEQVISSAPPMLNDTIVNSRMIEVTKIIAESYYRTKQYKNATDYFLLYSKHKQLTDNDYYQLAFSYYQLSDYDNAVINFKNIKSSQDSLAQNSCYHLADCYLKTNERQLAMNSFYQAYKIDKDKGIKEDALYNYAKLAYELSYNPFNEAIKAFEQYINDYPNSSRKDEAYGYLTKVYLSTKNYQAAIQSIENIKQLTPELKSAYQKISYYRAVQFFSDANYNEAIKYFDKSLQYPNDKKYNALANYWKADAYYRKSESNKKYEDLTAALKFYKIFLFEDGASETETFQNINYAMGYTYFKLQDYTNAIVSFRKFTINKNYSNTIKLYDANLRIADSYFVTKDYNNALEFYTKALDIKGNDDDYALYQKAIVLGLLGKYELKSKTLTDLLSSKSKSEYEAASNYELARAYDLLGENEKAYTYYSKVVANHPNFSFTPNAMLQMGNIQNKNGKYDDALQTLNSVVSKFPGNEAAYEAINIMREVCKKKGDNDCLDKLKTLGYANITVTKLDSDNFEIAKNYFYDEKFDDALKSLNKYIQKYPDGIFLVDANFYKAECEYKKGNLSAALGCYNYVTDKPHSRFTENSLSKAAYINYKMANYDLALEQYIKLDKLAEFNSNKVDAKLGVMRCYFNLSKWDLAIVAASDLKTIEKLADENRLEANMVVAKSYYELKKWEEAKTEFAKLLTQQNEIAAEAKYYIALIQYNNKQYKESQKTIFELINQKPSYGIWLGKSFLLLSDNYLELNDRYNAKYTLKTYIEKSTNAQLVEEAKGKLAAIIEIEKMEEEMKQRKSAQDLNIDFKSNDINDSELFDEQLKENGGQ